jgi:hypothetical protein
MRAGGIMKAVGGDCDLTASLTGMARLVHEAGLLAARAAKAAENGDRDAAMNIALELELLLDEAAEALHAAFIIDRQNEEPEWPKAGGASRTH